MKKNFFNRVFVTLVSVVLMCSCSDNSKLKLAVKAADAQCPNSLSESIEMTHVAYENNTVNYYYTVEENYVDIDNMAANPEAQAEALIDSFLSAS